MALSTNPVENPLAVSAPLGIVGDYAGVALDVDLKFFGRFTQCLDTRVVGLNAFQVHDQLLDHTMAVMDVTVPQVALDLAQETVCGSSFIRIVMAQSLDVLAHDGDAHGDVEPVEEMLGCRCHVLCHVPHRIAAISQEGDSLVFLPSLLFQDLVQTPLWPAVVGVNKAEVAVWPIGRHGLGDHHLEMWLALVPRAHVTAIDADR